jgi:dihydrofolate reductase
MKINLIVAHCKSRGIGLSGSLPWNIKKDMAHFYKTTIGDGNNAIVMGRKTWDSLNNKPLKNRLNFVISRNETEVNNINLLGFNNVKAFTSIDELLNYVDYKFLSELWIIGGSQIYNEFIKNYSSIIDNCVITYIDREIECDVFFPELSNLWYITKKINIEDDVCIQYWNKITI